jgi:hypothetical protein
VGVTLVLALAGLSFDPSVAQADVQVSARYGLGFGATTGELQREFVFETLLRMEALFGAPGDEHFRVGPALDLRTWRFDTAEAAVGLAVLMPIVRGFPLTLTLAAGYAARSVPFADGPIGVATLAWGYRSYNFHSAYGLGLQVFVSGRVHLDEPGRWEVTAGIEIDLEAMIAIPAAFLISLFRKGPPDEPDVEEEN